MFPAKEPSRNDKTCRQINALIQWHGWHAFRRGLATNLYRLGVKDKVIQAILRHSNLSTTMNAYVKSVSLDATAAMRTLEAIYATSMQPAAESPTIVLQ